MTTTFDQGNAPPPQRYPTNTIGPNGPSPDIPQSVLDQIAAQQPTGFDANGNRLSGPGARTGSDAGSMTSSLSSSQQSAMAVLAQVLQGYGLNSLLPWVQQQLIRGASPDQIALLIRDTPEFNQRFPAIRERQQAGLPPLSPSDYVNLEQSYTQVARAYGLPPGFYDNAAAFHSLIAGDVSPTEFQQRVEQGFSAVANAPQAVQDAFSSYYGVQGRSALASLFLDQNQSTPILLRMAETAQIGGQAAQYGITAGRGLAEQIQQSGISEFQRHAAFVQANQERPLTQQTVGEADRNTSLTTDQLVKAATGLSADDQLAVATALRQRAAAVTGSGGAAAPGQGGGVGGLGEQVPGAT